MALKLISLEIKNLQSNATRKYPLDQVIVVNQNDAALILQSILNLVSIPSPLEAESILEISLDNINLKIQKNYSKNEIKYLIDGNEQKIDIYSWLSEKLNLKIDPAIWEGRLVDFKDSKIESIDDLISLLQKKDSVLQLNPGVAVDLENAKNELEKLKSESSKGLTAEQVQKIDRLRDIKTKISGIQKEVDNYQNQKDGKEDLEKKIKEKEQEVNILKDKLSSVSTLMQNKEQIVKDLQKYNISESSQNIHELKEAKYNETNKLLQTAYTKPIHKSINDEDESQGLHLDLGKIILIAQIPVTLTLVIIAYLLIKLDLILILGFIVIAIEFAFIIFEFNKKHEPDYALLQPEVPQVLQEEVKADPSTDKFFINQAWRSAYEHELEKIEQLILNNLDSKSYEEVQSEMNLKSSELDTLKKEENNNNSNALDSEAYYKKRRELDILKIEKENLEFGGNLQVENEDQLDSLSAKVSELESLNDSMEALKEGIPIIAINLNEKVKSFIEQLKGTRQIVLITNK